jgi:hypothetical protein
MKTRGWLVAAILSTVVPFYGISQCGTSHTISYDTTITGNGINDDPYVFTFPQFNPSLGTLTNVDINTKLTLQYNYTVENDNPVSSTFRFKVTRFDDIYSPALGPSEPLQYQRTFPNSLSAQTPANYYTHVLAANDGVAGSGSDFAQASLTLVNQSNIIVHAANTAPFMGTGNVAFDYYTYTLGGAPNSFTFSPTVTDQITFSIKYTYCDNILLNNAERERLTRSTGRIIFNHKLYPNPSSSGNYTVQFNNATRSDWQIETFSSTGQLLSRKKYSNTLRADVTDNQLPKGIYIIKATNLKSQENFTERLLVK